MTIHLRERFDLAGYRAGAPCPEAAAIDREVCEESACAACRRPAPRFRPFYHPKQGVYRAFAVCEACGHVDEI
jgi:hypothetical protein